MIILNGDFCSMSGSEMDLLMDLSRITAGLSTQIDSNKIRIAAEMGLDPEIRENFQIIDVSKEISEKKTQMQTENMVRKLMDEISKTGDEE